MEILWYLAALSDTESHSDTQHADRTIFKTLFCQSLIQRMGPEAASWPVDRTNAYTGQYARACLELAAELGLPSVDLWTAMQEGEVRQQRKTLPQFVGI